MSLAPQEQNDFFKSKVLGHPSGLFVLFFTEMWERFSYYGMRALLVVFLTSSYSKGGWEWSRENALAVYGSYTSIAYLTPILGGYLADKFLGYRWAVIIGAFIMTLGHISMALEFDHAFMYLGLVLLVVGNGFFKPNMTSIVSEMYKDHPEKKDGAYTIFYMGVNSGAFLGMLLCGYIGETISWFWGFGLAGIFMFIGMFQFYFTKGIFGDIGLKPNKNVQKIHAENEFEKERNPYSTLDLILIAFVAIVGLLWIVNDPVSKISGSSIFIFNFKSTVFGLFSEPVAGSNLAIVVVLILFLIQLIIRIRKYNKFVGGRMTAVLIMAFVTVFFWASFEQAGGSMTIFAKDYTDRILTGNSKMIFNVVNTLITVIPMLVISFVLIKLFRQTYKKYATGNIVLGVGFLLIWAILIYMLKQQYSGEKAEVPATWFGILNSLFIISLAPLISKIWDSKFNPYATIKNGISMILLAIGFGFLAFGSLLIPKGAATASVSMVWLVLAYLFHTLGELFISPVGLSYISKLVPARMIGMMFGVWYIAIALGNKLGGIIGGQIDKINGQYSLTQFFLIFTLVPIGLGVIIMLLTPVMKRMMHGVK